MADVADTPQVVRFGVFEVDLRAGELRKKGVRIRLQEQPLQVLAVLLEQPGQLVTREELKQKLWGGTIVDFDHSINTTINKLREALGDSADTPRFIETLPRRGYRFIYPVNGAIVDTSVPVNGAPVATIIAPMNGAPILALPGGLEDASKVRQPAASWSRRRAAAVVMFALLLVLLVLALNVGGVRDQMVGGPGAVHVTSIAVLPLKNVSAGAQQEYFVDGMTEALIIELGKISALRVLSYQSMIGYRQTAKSLPQIARELKVDAFLEGSVFHSGERVRITANLIQASPKRHLWAESYEFNLRDVVAVQGEVARDVARRIRVKLTPGEQMRLTTSRPVDSEAYEAYLLGRAHLSKTATQTSWNKAQEYFEKAIDKDPAYAPAYAALAELYIRHRGKTRKSFDARLQARQWGEKALKLDETLADAHAVLGRAAQQDWDWAGTEREFRRAIELNPSHATARIWYAMYLYAMQRFEEAVVEARRAQQVDPASAHVNTWAGGAYFAAGRAEEGVASARKALELDPSFFDASVVLGRIHVTQGKYEEAIAELERAVTFNQGQELLLGALAHAYARGGHREKALKIVGELNRIDLEERGYTPFGLIWAYAGLGDKERAFALLEKCYQERYGRMVWLNVDPLLEPLRSDARFADLARRVGLPTLASPPRR